MKQRPPGAGRGRRSRIGFHSGGALAYRQSKRKFDEPGQDHQRVQADRREELAEDDLQVADRRRRQELDRSLALLLGEQPHGQHGREEQRHDRHVVHAPADDPVVEGQLGLRRPSPSAAPSQGLPHEEREDEEEEDPEEQRPDEQGDVGDGAAEVVTPLLLDHGADVAECGQAAPPSACGDAAAADSSAASAVVRSRKISSRLIPTCVQAEQVEALCHHGPGQLGADVPAGFGLDLEGHDAAARGRPGRTAATPGTTRIASNTAPASRRAPRGARPPRPSGGGSGSPACLPPRLCPC